LVPDISSLGLFAEAKVRRLSERLRPNEPNYSLRTLATTFCRVNQEKFICLSMRSEPDAEFQAATHLRTDETDGVGRKRR